MNYRKSSMVLGACLSLVFLACGDDSGSTETGAGSDTTEGSATESNDSSGSNPTATATESATATMTATGDGTGATTEATSASDATEGATEGDTTEGPATDGTTTAAEGCEGLNRMECGTNEMCMPIVGRPIMMMGDGACLGEPEFLECQDAMGCGDAITYGCENEEAMLYEFLDTCIPLGWMECPPPPIDLMPC